MEQVLITGANRGIGLELSRQYKARGAQVIGACRQSSEALDALGIQVHSGFDVTSDEDVAALASSLDQKLDLLINCAGILEGNSLGQLDFDSIRRQFEVNSVGPLRVTAGLLPHLAEGAKVAIITSRMGSISDNGSGGSYGYRMSKSAVNAAGASLAVDLKPQGIAVALLHPGYVRTDMTGGNGLVDANESAAGLIARIDGLNVDNSGSFWHMNGELLPW
jgi:NAD(P)-dependent dehydrogenase (short-subunit alcohol dehydrogenase family)